MKKLKFFVTFLMKVHAKSFLATKTSVGTGAAQIGHPACRRGGRVDAGTTGVR